MPNFGRPLKGKSRRIPFTLHAPVGLLDIIDEYTDRRTTESGKPYSRSDFYAEAAVAYLKLLGLEPDEEEAQISRCKIVAEKNTGKNNRDKLWNLNTKNQT